MAWWGEVVGGSAYRASVDFIGRLEVDVEASRRHGGIVLVSKDGLTVYAAPAPVATDAPTNGVASLGDGWVDIGSTTDV